MDRGLRDIFRAKIDYVVTLNKLSDLNLALVSYW